MLKSQPIVFAATGQNMWARRDRVIGTETTTPARGRRPGAGVFAAKPRERQFTTTQVLPSTPAVFAATGQLSVPEVLQRNAAA